MSSLEQLLKQMANLSEIAWNEETYDLALASGLSAGDRSIYVGKLLETAALGDSYAILTLGYLHATEALPLLRAAANSQDPWAQTARRALVLLGHGAEVVEKIVDDAVNGRAKMGRVAAVMDLAKVGGAIAIAALQQALADSDDTVRLLAWDGLVEVLDLLRLIRSPEGTRELTTELELLQVLLGSDIAAFVRMGSDGMRELTERLQAGATPQSLGIAWRPDSAPELFAKLRLTLFDEEASFPVDEIAQLTGFERRMAELMIALRLENQDRRVPEALTRLAASWTAPALEEVASSTATSPELRQQLTQSLRALKK